MRLSLPTSDASNRSHTPGWGPVFVSMAGVVLALELAFFSAGCSRQTVAPAGNAHPVKAATAAYLSGQREAQQDIRNGQLILKTFGLPAPWSGIYYSNLMSQYQIEVRGVAGCDVSEQLAESVRGYNETATAEIEKRFGAGLVKRVAQASEQQWQRGFGKP